MTATSEGVAHAAILDRIEALHASFQKTLPYDYSRTGQALLLRFFMETDTRFADRIAVAPDAEALTLWLCRIAAGFTFAAMTADCFGERLRPTDPGRAHFLLLEAHTRSNQANGMCERAGVEGPLAPLVDNMPPSRMGV